MPQTQFARTDESNCAKGEYRQYMRIFEKRKWRLRYLLSKCNKISGGLNMILIDRLKIVCKSFFPPSLLLINLECSYAIMLSQIEVVDLIAFNRI